LKTDKPDAKLMALPRIIGSYTGPERGPLLCCIGGMHGNELAGVRALEIVFKMLELEPMVNHEFSYKGKLIGLRGNLRALERGVRFIKRDLNRMWTEELVQYVRHSPTTLLQAEERELKELLELLEREVNAYQPDKIILLDIHTTTAHGGIFSIATDDPESIRIATNLHAPVITGMLRGLSGTTLHWFVPEHFGGTPTTGVAFEAGQHQDPLSVNRSISAIINCMRSIGAVKPEDVENRHDKLLITYAKGLPKIAELRYVYHIREGEHFHMIPGFKNFQPVRKGQALAYNESGLIAAPIDGRILMPLYQSKGEDGFFIVEEVPYRQ